MQPYRANAARRQTAALGRMQRGKGPLHHLASARQEAMRRNKRGRRGNRRYSSPLARILRGRKRVGGY
jgi:transcription initiation factor TFIID subunit TAF12